MQIVLLRCQNTCDFICLFSNVIRKLRKINIWKVVCLFLSIFADFQERKQERERRKTQEISFFKPKSGEEQVRRSSDVGLKVEPLELAVGLEGAKTPSPALALKTDAAKSADRERALSGGDLEATPAGAVLQLPGQKDVRKAQSFRDGLTPGARGAVAKSGAGKKTPTFTTRRPHSLKKVRQWDELERIDMGGFLERKQELQSGAKRATIRSWKQYYTILCGQLLCFFRVSASQIFVLLNLLTNGKTVAFLCKSSTN